MYYIAKWQHMSYDDKKELACHIANHRCFSSRVSPQNGEMIASGNSNEYCRKCNQYKLYVIKSYDKTIYSICENCGNEYCYEETWEGEKGNNGLMTTILQEILCMSFDSFRAKREEYLNQVREARKWLNSTRRRAFRLGSRSLSDQYVLQVVQEKKALKNRTA
jgi:hypothetical protein